MTVQSTACPLDCPDSCSLDIHRRDGRIESLSGSHRNPLTKGFICSKVKGFGRHVYGDERILYPALRVGAKGEGRFRRIPWDEALDRVVEAIRDSVARGGPESLLPLNYGGSNGLVSHLSADRRLFRRLGASRLVRSLCAAPSTAAATGLYGKMVGVSLDDFNAARLIVLWGVNPSATGIHVVPRILEAQRAGARLIVVDPRRTPLAGKADLHIAPRPGTDLALALSVISWLFESGNADLEFLTEWAHGTSSLKERCAEWTLEKASRVADVPSSQLLDLCRMYRDASPAVIRCGWGLERNRNGGSAVAAVLALPAVAGKFGVRGGGYTMSNSGAWDWNTDQACNAAPPDTRSININQTGRALLSARPPIHFTFIFNSNPASTFPQQQKIRQGLRRDDLFTVVMDSVLTDTARYGDLILPSTTFLEQHDFVTGYGATVAHECRPAIDPVAEARPNFDVFCELTRRLGLETPSDAISSRDYIDKVVGATPGAKSVRQQLESTGIALPETGFHPVQFVHTFPKTRDGKIHLVPESLDEEAPAGLYAYGPDPASAEFPLALISPASGSTISSTLGQLDKTIAALEIHPRDARPRDIAQGDVIEVFNDSGAVRCPASITRRMRPGTVYLPKGLWDRHALNGNTANTLAPDSLTDLGSGACFNDARVEIRKLPAAHPGETALPSAPC